MADTAVIRGEGKRVKRLLQEVQELKAGNARLDKIATYNRQLVQQLRLQLNAALRTLGKYAVESEERERTLVDEPA